MFKDKYIDDRRMQNCDDDDDDDEDVMIMMINTEKTMQAINNK